MILEYVQKKSDRLIAAFERWSNKKYWSLRVAVYSMIISLFTAFPSYDLFFKDFTSNQHHWYAISEQINHPLSQKKYETISHESNISFRLSVPVAGHLLGLKNLEIKTQIIVLFILQLLALFVFFYVLSLIFYHINQDRVASSLLTFSFGLIYAGNSLTLDIWGCMDVVAYCFLALAILTRRPLEIFIFTLLASYCDERALIASCLVFLWHTLRTKKAGEYNFRKDFINLASASVLGSWLAYFILRFILMNQFGFETNTHSARVAPIVIKEAANNIPIGIWSGLEGWWIVVLLSLLVLVIQKKWILFLLVTGAMSLITLVAFSILDITRSMAYIFPLAIVGYLIISSYESRNNLRYLSLIVLFICLFPTYYIGGQHTAKWLYPLPLQVLRILADSKTFSLTF